MDRSDTLPALRYLPGSRGRIGHAWETVGALLTVLDDPDLWVRRAVSFDNGGVFGFQLRDPAVPARTVMLRVPGYVPAEALGYGLWVEGEAYAWHAAVGEINRRMAQ
jgi:hypothetical protein